MIFEEQSIFELSFFRVHFFFFFFASRFSNEDKTKFRKLVGQSKGSGVQMPGFEFSLISSEALEKLLNPW